MDLENLDLEQLRRDIDAIDAQLTALFEKRMDLVLQVAAFKRQNKKEVLDSAREAQVLAKVKALAKNPAYEPYLEDFFIGLMALSKALQKNILEKEEASHP